LDSKEVHGALITCQGLTLAVKKLYSDEAQKIEIFDPHGDIALTQTNCGAYVFRCKFLKDLLAFLRNKFAVNDIYLPDQANLMEIWPVARQIHD
jgi:hypothetical protein